MAFDDSLVQDVLRNTDIVKIVGSFLPLAKKGKNYLAKCPFHDDSNPSLTVSPEKQMFKCFVCGTGGSAITFVQKYLHISFMEALKKVAELSGYVDTRLETIKHEAKQVDPKKVPMLKAMKDTTAFYQYALNTNEGKEGLDYFENRHLDSYLRSKYMLGYSFKDGQTTAQFLQSKGNSLKTLEDIGIVGMSNGVYSDKNQGRVVFPICDADGNVVGFSARRLGNGSEAKYVNSPETYIFHKSNILYNYHIAKDKAKIAGHIYVCEGFMDVFALARIGMDNAVALMGTALSVEHINMLRALNVEVRLCLDGDLPGQTAMMKAAKMLDEAGIKVLIVDNQASPKDPDEILNEDGEETLRVYLNKLLTRTDFALDYYRRTNPLKSNEEKRALIKSFLPILLRINSQLELDNYLLKLSSITGYNVQSLRDLIVRSRSSQNYENTETVFKNFHPEREALKKLTLVERELLYQMIHNPTAVVFYEKNVQVFIDDIYRAIASAIVDYSKKVERIMPTDLMAAIEMSSIENKEAILDELSTICFENNHPKKCDDKLLNDLLTSMKKEKDDIYEKDTLERSLEGKSPLEKARIMADYNRRKLKKMSNDNKEE